MIAPAPRFPWLSCLLGAALLLLGFELLISNHTSVAAAWQSILDAFFAGSDALARALVAMGVEMLSWGRALWWPLGLVFFAGICALCRHVNGAPPNQDGDSGADAHAIHLAHRAGLVAFAAAVVGGWVAGVMLSYPADPAAPNLLVVLVWLGIGGPGLAALCWIAAWGLGCGVMHLFRKPRARHMTALPGENSTA